MLEYFLVLVYFVSLKFFFVGNHLIEIKEFGEDSWFLVNKFTPQCNLFHMIKDGFLNSISKFLYSDKFKAGRPIKVPSVVWLHLKSWKLCIGELDVEGGVMRFMTQSAFHTYSILSNSQPPFKVPLLLPSSNILFHELFDVSEGESSWIESGIIGSAHHQTQLLCFRKFFMLQPGGATIKQQSEVWRAFSQVLREDLSKKCDVKLRRRRLKENPIVISFLHRTKTRTFPNSTISSLYDQIRSSLPDKEFVFEDGIYHANDICGSFRAVANADILISVHGFQNILMLFLKGAPSQLLKNNSEFSESNQENFASSFLSINPPKRLWPVEHFYLPVSDKLGLEQHENFEITFETSNQPPHLQEIMKLLENGTIDQTYLNHHQTRIRCMVKGGFFDFDPTIVALKVQEMIKKMKYNMKEKI